ncbi:MAG TPA: S-layer homology domain-containing protein [Acidimicrobiia bacterium]|nr:S-layer homology domain-containing protein [Acidimicrobiia bacterium]
MLLRIVITSLAAVLTVAIGSPAGATTLVQTFEHETWDEQEDQTLLEAIEALREAHPYLVDVRNLDMTRTRTTRGYTDKGLEVVIPPGGFRGFGPYARLSEVADEAWFRYNVFLADFRPVSSGKLPGLADASITPTAKGCKPSTEADPGWSARLMFDTVGTDGVAPDEVPIGYYLYHLGQARTCGDELMFEVGLSQRRWTCIEGHVRMNTPGSADGMIEAWVDGERVFQRSGLAFRRPGESIGIREMWNNVYFGGSYPTPNQLGLILDDVAVDTDGRVGCVDPFVDDDHSIHEGALTELYARQLLFGCADRAACPDDRLTRAQFAAIVQRLLGTPPGPDAFRDDEGLWAEEAINSLANLGILRGCNPPANTEVCPSADITRAQAAAMVRRMLGLPQGPDAFSDDDGIWAEGDINAIAAAGITRGCGPSAYCPDEDIIRAEAATFTVRVDDMLRSVKTLTVPDVQWPPSGPPPPKPPEERE